MKWRPCSSEISSQSHDAITSIIMCVFWVAVSLCRRWGQHLKYTIEFRVVSLPVVYVKTIMII